MKLQITSRIAIDDSEIQMDFIRSSGPGGQNVNKVATAVQLRFNAAASPGIPPEVKERLQNIAGTRITDAGILIIDARRFRSQVRNREDAVKRLIYWIRRAAEEPGKRKKTRTPRSAHENRLKQKKHRSRVKEHRKRPASDLS